MFTVVNTGVSLTSCFITTVSHSLGQTTHRPMHASVFNTYYYSIFDHRMKQFRNSAEKMKKKIILGRKSGAAKTIFGQKSGPAMAGPAVPLTTALCIGFNFVRTSKEKQKVILQLEILSIYHLLCYKLKSWSGEESV